jgi:ABC-type antimicrobial peptide transport system permease subunit
MLAATGIYGVLNYQVLRRLPDMGIRMALGASARDVLRLVLREGLALTAAGVLLGAAGSLVAARWLGSLLYGVSPRDPSATASHCCCCRRLRYSVAGVRPAAPLQPTRRI